MLRKGATVLLAVGLYFAKADEFNHKYTDEEVVTLWVNSVGPYHNPQETYGYYQLPFCKPSFGIDTKKRASGIGEILEGNNLHNSGLKLHFKQNIKLEDVCDVTLDEASVKAFENAVDRQVIVIYFVPSHCF